VAELVARAVREALVVLRRWAVQAQAQAEHLRMAELRALVAQGQPGA